MSIAKGSLHERKQDTEPMVTLPGFDVTCVIGRVEFGGKGDEPPHVVAMKLIARHDAEGTYKFPHHDGGTCVVTVEYE